MTRTAQRRVSIELRQCIRGANDSVTLSPELSPTAPFDGALQSLSVAGRVAKVCWPKARWSALKGSGVQGIIFDENIHRLPVVAVVVHGEATDSVVVSLERVLPVFDELQEVYSYAIRCKVSLPPLVDLPPVPDSWTVLSQEGTAPTVRLERQTTVAFDPCAALARLKELNPQQTDPKLASGLVPNVGKATAGKLGSTGTGGYTKLQRRSGSTTASSGPLVVSDSDAQVAMDLGPKDGPALTTRALNTFAAAGPSGGYGRAVGALVVELSKAKLLPANYRGRRQPTIAWTCMRVLRTPAAQVGKVDAKIFQPWNDGGPLDTLTQTLGGLAGCRVRSGAFLPSVKWIGSRIEFELDVPPRRPESDVPSRGPEHSYVPLDGAVDAAAACGTARALPTALAGAVPFVIGARQVFASGGVSVLRFEVVRSGKVVATTRLLVRDPPDVLAHFGHGAPGQLFIGEGAGASAVQQSWLSLGAWLEAYAADSKATPWGAQWPAAWGAAVELPTPAPLTLALVNCSAVGNPAVNDAQDLAAANAFRAACNKTTRDPVSGIARILCFQGSVEYSDYFLYRTDSGAPSASWELGLLGAVSGAVLAWLAQGRVSEARKLWILGGLAAVDWRGVGDDHTVPVWFEGGKEWNPWYLVEKKGGARLLRGTVSKELDANTWWNKFVRVLLYLNRTGGKLDREMLAKVVVLSANEASWIEQDLANGKLATMWPNPWRWPIYLEAYIGLRLLDHWRKLKAVSHRLTASR